MCLIDYTFSIQFDEGVTGTIHLDDLVSKGIFKTLQDKVKFAKI